VGVEFQKIEFSLDEQPTVQQDIKGARKYREKERETVGGERGRRKEREERKKKKIREKRAWREGREK